MSFSIDHTPFIVGSYVVFALLMLADFVGALRARRRTLDALRARARRAARRGAANTGRGLAVAEGTEGTAAQ